MDPIQNLLNLIKGALAGQPAVFAAIERDVRGVLDRFALVPKHEYTAHLEILTTLQGQVADLEARLAAMEAPRD